MNERGQSEPITAAKADTGEVLETANRLYREYHTRCFWHCPRDLAITSNLVPFVVRGLRKHGGRRGFILAAKLERGESISADGDCGLPKCR